MIYLKKTNIEKNEFRVYLLERDGCTVRRAWGRHNLTTQKINVLGSESEAVAYMRKELRLRIKRGYTTLVYPQGRLF